MKKHIIIAVTFTACLVLCAAVWPQSEAAEEIPTPPQMATVRIQVPTDGDNTATEVRITPPAEEKKVEIPKAEPFHEIIPEQEPVSEKIPAITEVQPAPEPQPEFVPAPPPSQMVTDPQPGNMVYVPSFGWLESQGSSETIYDESIYENGNKIGTAG